MIVVRGGIDYDLMRELRQMIPKKFPDLESRIVINRIRSLDKYNAVTVRAPAKADERLVALLEHELVALGLAVSPYERRTAGDKAMICCYSGKKDFWNCNDSLKRARVEHSEIQIECAVTDFLGRPRAYADAYCDTPQYDDRSRKILPDEVLAEIERVLGGKAVDLHLYYLKGIIYVPRKAARKAVYQL